MTYREVGRITLTKFNRLYAAYKDLFDLEMRMRNANMTYAKLEEEQQAQELWLP